MFARGSLLGKRRADAHVAKPRRRGAVSGSHGLHRLTLPTIWRAPERPILAPANRVARIPEFGGDSAVARVLQHAAALPGLDFPGNFRGKLKLIAAVIDGPGT